MNGISVLIKGPQRVLSLILPGKDIARRQASRNQKVFLTRGRSSPNLPAKS